MNIINPIGIAPFTIFYHTVNEVLSALPKLLFAVRSERVDRSELCAFMASKALYVPVYHRKDSITYLFNTVSSPNLSILLTTLSDGESSLMRCINRIIKGKSINVKMDSLKEAYPYNAFEYYEGGEITRMVRSMRDYPRWQFYETGTPLFFEDLENYKAKMIKHKVTPEILLSYLKKLGFDLNDPSFWEPGDIVHRLYIR